MTLIDWPGLVRAGLGALRLEPRVFWHLTPVELQIMLGAEGAAPALTRARLEQLAAAFPDAVKGLDHGGNFGTSRSDTGA